MERSSGRRGGDRSSRLERDLDVDLEFDRLPGTDRRRPVEDEDELEPAAFVSRGAEPATERPAGRRPERQPRPRRRRAGRERRPPERGEAVVRAPRRRSETVARILWALPWIVFVIVIIAAGGLTFAAALLVLACIGLAEFFRMAREEGPIVPVAFIAAAGMIAAAYWGDQFQILLAGAAAFPLMFLVAAVRGSPRGITRAMAITAFGVLWIALPFAHAVLLRELPLHGGALLIDVLVATFVGDTAAYAGGRLFGRHPLAPSLSPNKTVEGLAFGFVGGTMGFWFAGLYQNWLPGLDALVMGMGVAALAPVGDLFESMIKRDLEVKDSGNVFGPHGGLLDRVDALLFTVVAGYYLSIAFVY